ncbi:hypothetical protein F2Q68_00014696 [Brassica cretica]|uniref:4a-hydroxytetrahydrobiopterin dehydratase n=1 Tax=Brassica cretica TaxID=69181 RepID=A0A8S9HKN2_BRACR|nr:hypothetical protein F2Q68_00014696 [Brassica cretica]
MYKAHHKLLLSSFLIVEHPTTPLDLKDRFNAGHHPDLHLVGWNNVKIDIWTHAIGGLTENDFILAAKINQLQVEDLLRKKKVAK